MFDNGQGWLIWLGAALLMVGIEVATVDFMFLMLAGGALGGSAAAALGAPVTAQAVVAAVVAVVLLVTVRPWLKGKFSTSEVHKMGAAAQIGRSAFVLDRVSESGGRIKLSGDEWTARSTSGELIEPGEEVVIDRIDGATAVVSRARVTGS
ncbi:MAG: NfeD family protein [Micrococcales bacterium]|nr:NfeD family protein [Micrococcales bacterium]